MLSMAAWPTPSTSTAAQSDRERRWRLLSYLTGRSATKRRKKWAFQVELDGTMADMARRIAPPPPPPDFEENIVDIDVAEEMRGSFLEYAYSVIYQRALPDARDGLKPVQRRILYQMNEMGLRPDRGHVKCARVVGEVMGRLHPHGDTAIYDALVRLGQPWVMRLPLVDPHGNFGSLGGEDPAAAMRYTEARFRAISLNHCHALFGGK